MAAAVLVASILGCTGAAGLKDYKLTVSPTTLKMGENELELVVTDAQGRPATDLSVSFDCVHRTMEMEKQVVAASHTGEGRYRGKVAIAMAGSWAILVDVSRGGQRLGRQEFSFEVKP